MSNRTTWVVEVVLHEHVEVVDALMDHISGVVAHHNLDATVSRHPEDEEEVNL